MQRDIVYRRYQRERKIEKVRSWMEAHWHYGYASMGVEERREQLHELALKRHSAPKACSCWCCGNPRTQFGDVTIQEKKAKFSCIEALAEEDIRSKVFIRKRKY